MSEAETQDWPTEDDLIDPDIPEIPHEFVGGHDNLFCQLCSRPRHVWEFHVQKERGA